MLWTWLMVPARVLRFTLRHLPSPLLDRLDAWSHRVARRRWERRRTRSESN
jgi:hypothetical protein